MIEREFNAALEHRRAGRLEEAVAGYRRVLALDPQAVPAHFNLGNALAALGRHGEAEAAFRTVLALAPQDVEATASLGIALRDQARHEEAAEFFRRAAELRPERAEFHNDLANALTELGRYGEAEAGLRRALERARDDAVVHHNLARLLLAQGRYEDGWREFLWRERWPWFDARLRIAPPAGAWDEASRGAAFSLIGEQGLGDQLFFLRFAGRLKALGAGPLAAQVDSRLAPLLARAGWNTLRPVRAREVLVGDLPWFVRMAGREDIPAPVALRPLPAELEKMRATLAGLGPPPYVGVTWRAGTPKSKSLFKEIAPELLAAALRGSAGTVIVLQRGATARDVEAFGRALGRPAHDLGAPGADLEALLALLSLLDDYVGVSSTNMHLRAGLGLAARVLVPMPPDWRWMASGEESPWFPGCRVYRQGADRSWREALGRLAQDLGG